MSHEVRAEAEKAEAGLRSAIKYLYEEVAQPHGPRKTHVRRVAGALERTLEALTNPSEPVEAGVGEGLRESIKLAMADALCWTDADDPTLNEDALDALLEGGQLLRDGASEEQEKAWLGRLLAAGFNLVPAADPREES